MKILVAILAAAAACWGSTTGGLRAYRRGDYQTAFKIWLADSERGDRDSQYHLALLYRDGEGVSKDLGLARKWLQRSADAGFDHAQSELGWFCYKGIGGLEDVVEARSWYEKSVAQGDLVAANRLGLIYLNGRGVAVDDARAFELFQKASYSLRSAMFNMGLMYENGRGRPKDMVEAVAWYSLAAKKGEPGAAEERDTHLRELSPDQKAKARSREAALNRQGMWADLVANGMHYLYFLRGSLSFAYGVLWLIGYFWKKKTPHVHREFVVNKSRLRRCFLWYRPGGVLGWILHFVFFLVLAISVIAFMALATMPIDQGWIGFAITLLVVLALAHWVAMHWDRTTFGRTLPIMGAQ